MKYLRRNPVIYAKGNLLMGPILVPRRLLPASPCQVATVVPRFNLKFPSRLVARDDPDARRGRGLASASCPLRK